jgi:3-phenylpropionate/trans-cinnamate dioxygenase ferredoxin subunit
MAGKGSGSNAGDDMSEWIDIGVEGELLPGEFKVVWDGDTPIAVYNLDGDYYAVEDTCTHDGGDLAGGEVFGFEVECPRHGARFDLRTGAALSAPAYTPTTVFPVRREDGAVWTRDDRGL